ncbi:MAG: hypothetical protein HYX78_14100 [Armatimonadetes bacterium]|nr:hypothetical protein [Armatimonadota bacterium]
MSGLDKLTRRELIGIIVRQEQETQALRAELDMLGAELSDKTGGSGAAPFIKPNRKERREQERAERKKRSQSYARKLSGRPRKCVMRWRDAAGAAGSLVVAGSIQVDRR